MGTVNNNSSHKNRRRNLAQALIPWSPPRWDILFLFVAASMLTAVQVGLTVSLTFWQSAFYNALSAKDWHSFLALLLWWHFLPNGRFIPSFTLVAALLVPAVALTQFALMHLQIRWRQHITELYLDRWLTDGTHYRLTLSGDGIDNPDQRIAEDIKLFVEQTTSLGIGVWNAVITLLSFVTLLWTLSSPITIFGMVVHGYLVWIALIYSAVGTLLVQMVGRPLIARNFQQQRREADFRHGLIRLQEFSESIAFFRGEREERVRLVQLFTALRGNWRRLTTATLALNLFTESFAKAALVFPFIAIAPAYFAGRMSLGGIFQTSNALLQVQGALSWLVQSYAIVSEWRAVLLRLEGFLDTLDADSSSPRGQSGQSDDSSLEVRDVSLFLPNGRELLRQISFSVEPGERVMLTGTSGSGKTTLLRAVMGLWPFMQGEVMRPRPSQLYMAQRPYLPSGTLRHALCYPSSDEAFEDRQLEEALRVVGLEYLNGMLADRVPLRAFQLSPGEQQLVALARAVLLQPEWLFLDEATASLDSNSERRFYDVLRNYLPKTTVISVTHRGNVDSFYGRIIEIAREAKETYNLHEASRSSGVTQSTT